MSASATPYRRIPRKMKKLYRRHGYRFHRTAEGRLYATRSLGPFRATR